MAKIYRRQRQICLALCERTIKGVWAMEQRKARVAIIGAGGIANGVHLPSLAEIENATLVAEIGRAPV